MKIFLDDVRDPQEIYPQELADSFTIIRDPKTFKMVVGWNRTQIEEISFDHDLGVIKENGSSLLSWIEYCIAHGIITAPKAITLHTANIAGREQMMRAALSIQRKFAHSMEIHTIFPCGV